ncbi:MAG: PilZ domain-containing protein [Kangiellaceae bacterium]
MSTSNRRSEQRLPINVKVKVTTETFCTRNVVTSDFSEGGIYVKDLQLAELSVGSLVTVQSDEGLADAPIIQARIAWTDEKGVGIQYLLQ